MQSLHRVRERWVIGRTAIVNQIRSLLLERGSTLRQGRHHVDAALPQILEDADLNLSGALRMLLVQLKLELDQMAMRIGEADAVLAAIGNGAGFREGQEFAAWSPNRNRIYLRRPTANFAFRGKAADHTFAPPQWIAFTPPLT
jgi:transposase